MCPLDKHSPHSHADFGGICTKAWRPRNPCDVWQPHWQDTQVRCIPANPSSNMDGSATQTGEQVVLLCVRAPQPQPCPLFRLYNFDSFLSGKLIPNLSC